MKSKTCTTPRLEFVEIGGASCLLASPGTTLKMQKGDSYSDGEQFSQGRQRETFWDGMDEE